MAGSSVHGFDESAHASKVNAHVAQVPGKTSGATHGGGVVPAPGDTPRMNGYGEVTSGQKGHPLTD